MKLQIISAKAALAAAAVISFGVMAEAPAEAAAIKGSISFSGAAFFPDFTTVGQTQTIEFTKEVVSETSGDFDGISPSVLDVQGLALTLESLTAVGPMTDYVFSNPGLSPFIDFGTVTIDGITSGLVFALDAAQYQGFRSTMGNFFSIFAYGPITGEFLFNGTESIGSGILSASRSGNIAKDGSFQITLTTTEIPTPALLPGLIGLGFGLLRKQKDEEMETAEADS